MIHLNIGSNLKSKHGSRIDNIYLAINLLKDAKIQIKKVSNFYETPSYPNKDLPKFPIETKNLMQEYDLVEGKTLGKKLKLLEEFWVNNEFNISKDQINRIIRN